MKNNILLIMPSFYGYYKEIIRELNNLNYYVRWYNDTMLLNSLDKILSKISKKYKHKLFNNYFNSIIENEKNSNYKKIIIVFGGNFFTKEELFSLKKTFPFSELIYYAWDSICNFPNIRELLENADYALTFDPIDAKECNANFLPLFYLNNYDVRTEIKYDLSTVMTLYTEKIPTLDLLLRKIPDNIVVNINLITGSYLSHLHLLCKHPLFFIRYSKYIKMKKMLLGDVNDILNSSRVVLDCPLPNQVGLTMRTFEALYSKTKIITTNLDIVNYDFYNENNIKVISSDDLTINDSFFKSDFDESNTNVLKYNLSNFVKSLVHND